MWPGVRAKGECTCMYISKLRRASNTACRPDVMHKPKVGRVQEISVRIDHGGMSFGWYPKALLTFLHEDMRLIMTGVIILKPPGRIRKKEGTWSDIETSGAKAYVRYPTCNIEQLYRANAYQNGSVVGVVLCRGSSNGAAVPTNCNSMEVLKPYQYFYFGRKSRYEMLAGHRSTDIKNHSTARDRYSSIKSSDFTSG